MTKEEINVKKEELEAVISHLLYNFMNESGCIPTNIEVYRCVAFGNKIETIDSVKIVMQDNEYPAFHVSEPVTTS